MHEVYNVGRMKTIRVVAAVIEKDDRIMIARRSHGEKNSNVYSEKYY